jgi:hypothetical protein
LTLSGDVPSIRLIYCWVMDDLSLSIAVPRSLRGVASVAAIALGGAGLAVAASPLTLPPIGPARNLSGGQAPYFA